MPKDLLYVGNFRGADISVFDLETNKLAATIPTGSSDGDGLPIQPDSFSTHPGSTMMYGSAFPDAAEVGQIKKPGEIIAVDATTSEIAWRFPVSGQPHHLVVAPDGSRAYVPIRDRNYVEVVDLHNREVVGTAPCGWGPHGTRISADGKLLYVGTMWHDTLTVIDTTTLKQVQTVRFLEAVRPFVISDDGSTAYVQTSKLHGFHVVDLKSGFIRQTVHMPIPPQGIPSPMDAPFPFTMNHGLEPSHDRTLMFAAGSVTNQVVAYSVPDFSVQAVIDVGKEPAWIELSPDGNTVCVTNRGENTVSFIDAYELKEVAREKAGAYPSRMASIRLS